MNIERLLSTRGLVTQAPKPNDVRLRAEQAAPSPAKLFYGETYDDKGQTIDSMKYYFFLSEMASSLKNEGFNVDPFILVADSAACRNVGEDQQRQYMSLGKERFQFVERVNEIYNTGLKIIKMSDYINTPEFIEKRSKIMETCKKKPELMEAIEKTVPESKIEIERNKGFLYSFDEIATIINLDLKIGPPREDLYDNVAREIAKQRGEKELISLFLSPTFPMGMKWSYFFINEGIEDHGITAYKAGSKRLQRNRIIVGKSDPDYIKNLINESFISSNPALPNPVLDTGIICEMARKKLEKDDSPITLADDFYEGKISEKQLKEKVGNDVQNHILLKF
jgi:hypothetical protein